MTEQAGGDDGFAFAPSENTLKTCGLIEFENFEVVDGIVAGTLFLSVSGFKPTPSMEVSLKPVHYPAVPDYWEIQVVGCLSGTGLPVETPYTETEEITNFVGHQGIKIVGSGKPVYHDIKR